VGIDTGTVSTACVWSDNKLRVRVRVWDDAGSDKRREQRAAAQGRVWSTAETAIDIVPWWWHALSFWQVCALCRAMGRGASGTFSIARLLRRVDRDSRLNRLLGKRGSNCSFDRSVKGADGHITPLVRLVDEGLKFASRRLYAVVPASTLLQGENEVRRRTRAVVDLGLARLDPRHQQRAQGC
jgi:hypothetical protein